MSIHEDDLPKQRRLTVETTSPTTDVTRTVNVEVGIPQSTVSVGGTETVELVRGPRGPQGIPGPPGTPGSAMDASYTHHQAIAAAVWVITHPLPYIPNITIVTSAGEEVDGDIAYGSGTTITVSFSGAFSGIAYLS